MNRWTRKLHRWGALITFLPMLLVIVSGLLLQVKKEVHWVQPPTKKGKPFSLTIDWEKILDVARSVEEAQVNDWPDISRLDVRPDRGLVKVFCNNHWELQLDTSSGELLSSTYRRSDWIEQLHDGSFFSDSVKKYVFLPNGFILLGLWLTGVYLWWLPIGVKRKKRARQSAMKKNL
jgi:uncharacterized iron-regulated membrane protein